MTSDEMRFKARIKSRAQEDGIRPQVLLQNFMFERFFARLSRASVRENLVLKGGALISQYLGLSRRTTMDIDITLRDAPLTRTAVGKLVKSVFAVRLDDGINWKLTSVEPIRADDEYGGFRLKVIASLNTIVVPFSIDISTGDAITPAPSDYYFKSVFDDNAFYRLKAYTIETVIAEKLEAILSLGNVSTRPRDYYDAYMLTTAVRFSIRKLRSALKATIVHRGSSDVVRSWKSVLSGIAASSVMNERWRKYQREFPFAAGVGFVGICKQLDIIFSKVF